MTLIASFHSKNKLVEITKFLKDYNDDFLSTKDIFGFIEKDDTKNDCF